MENIANLTSKQGGENEKLIFKVMKRGEKLNLDMNEYMLDQYPQAYKVATDICKNLEGCIGHKLDETETGYLAMHIQRVYKDAV